MAYAREHDHTIIDKYVDFASGGSAHRPAFQRMLTDAKTGRFKLLLIWSLDRFSREGITPTRRYLMRLKSYGVDIISLTEPWLNTTVGDGALHELVYDLLIGVYSSMAEAERRKISERTRAGLARTNKKPGRPKGSKDSKPRRRRGYYERWQK